MNVFRVRVMRESVLLWAFMPREFILDYRLWFVNSRASGAVEFDFLNWFKVADPQRRTHSAFLHSTDCTARFVFAALTNNLKTKPHPNINYIYFLM